MFIPLKGIAAPFPVTYGQYILEGAAARPAQGLSSISPTDDPAGAFRYVSLFTGWREIMGTYVGENWVLRDRNYRLTELQRIEEPLIVDIQPGTRLDFALTQGYLTDILACGDRQRVETYQALRPGPARRAMFAITMNSSPVPSMVAQLF